MFFSTFAGGVNACPPGWTYFSNKCYLFHADSVTQEVAETFCKEKGAALLEIDSSIENQFIVDQALSARYSSFFAYYWTGFWLGKCGILIISFASNITQICHIIMTLEHHNNGNFTSIILHKILLKKTWYWT